MRPFRIILLAFVAICMIALSAISFHSVEEIHYLKSFFPTRFTVPDAASAAVVELIKYSFVFFPLALVVLVCLFLLWLFNKPAG